MSASYQHQSRSLSTDRVLCAVAADLRPALQLFDAAELHKLYCQMRFIDIDELLDRIDFTGWGSAAETPDMLRELLRQWNSDGQTKDLVTDLLVWVTGADGLDDGQRIIVEPMDDVERLPEAATCTLTLRLPPLGRTVGAAAEGNGVARLEEKLRLAMAHSVFGVQ